MAQDLDSETHEEKDDLLRPEEVAWAGLLDDDALLGSGFRTSDRIRRKCRRR